MVNTFYFISSRSALGPTPSLIQWVLWVLSTGVKRQGREADHSPPTSAEVKKTWIYKSTLPYIFMAYCLVKHRDNFTFILLLALRCEINSLQNYKITQSVCYMSGAKSRRLHYSIYYANIIAQFSDIKYPCFPCFLHSCLSLCLTVARRQYKKMYSFFDSQYLWNKATCS
jgi:hypothetical protein